MKYIEKNLKTLKLLHNIKTENTDEVSKICRKLRNIYGKPLLI